jgi:hypothetical protein
MAGQFDFQGEKVVRILEIAESYIRKGWCRGHFAVDEKGLATDPLGPRAVAWDLIGAVWRAVHETEASFEILDAVIDRLLEATGHQRLVEWNDKQESVEDILKVLGRAKVGGPVAQR